MEALYKRLERIRTSLQACILKRLKELNHVSIIPSEQPPESGELIELVDRYLDQRLDEAGRQAP